METVLIILQMALGVALGIIIAALIMSYWRTCLSILIVMVFIAAVFVGWPLLRDSVTPDSKDIAAGAYLVGVAYASYMLYHGFVQWREALVDKMTKAYLDNAFGLAGK